MLGRLLNTLSYRLARELRDLRKANKSIRDDAWPWYQRVLIAAGKHPVQIPLGLFLVIVFLSVAVCSYHLFCGPVTFGLPSQLPVSEQHFFTLWAVQATVAAMIYPIVIGFVALLLQRRHSAKASLQIYLHDSAAILTGLSALFMVLTMGVQYLFIAMCGIQVLAYWLLFDSAWFLANILGVIWFLYRTFDYLRPERRARIQRAYAINHIWPAEIRRNLEYNFFHRAVDYGWLPGPSYGDEGSDSNTEILIDPLGQEMGDVQVTVRNKDKRFIRDVRFRLLSCVIQSWQKREEQLAVSQKDELDVFTGSHRSRLFILPCAPGTQFKAAYGLCRTEGGTGLHWWEKQLVRMSFVFTPKKGKEPALNIRDVLDGMIAEVQVSMEAGEEAAFREALEELAALHIALILAGDIVTDEDQRYNYAILEDRDHFFGNRLHVLWAGVHHRLIETAVEKLSLSDTYFKQMAHVPGWLIDDLKTVRPIAIPGNLLHLSRSMHHRLNRWWSRTLEEQGSLNHSPCEPQILKAPAVAIYDDAIREYVGAWEALKNDRFPPTANETVIWEQYGEIGELYTGHLNGTTYMLFDSLILGNKEGSEWLCDSLIKWWDTMSFRFDDSQGYIHDQNRPTMELMEKPWEALRKVTDLSMPGVVEDNEPKVLWSACIFNYWIDLCCVSLYALIQFGKTCECESSLPAQLAGNLGKGRALRSGGGTVGSYWPIQTLEDLLISVLRQYYFDGGYHRGYRARLDKVVEGIFDIGKPAMVLGRVYSESDVDDLDTLTDGQLVLMCLLSNVGWAPSEQFMKVIQNWGREDDSGLRGFTKQLEQWKDRLNHASFREYEKFFSCIQAKFGAVETLEIAAAAVNTGLEQLLDGIGGFRDEQLREAQVSEERLSEIAKWSSRSGFSKGDGNVPVSLFREVQPSDEEYKEYSQSFTNQNKGEHVEPPMAQRASNEDEYFDRIISKSVAMHVMAETLRFLNPAYVDAETPRTYWEQIRFAALRIRKEGGTPILLVAGRGEPRWLLDWTRSNYDTDTQRPEGIRLVRDKKIEVAGYVGSLNGIPVFVAPIRIGSSYLISREALDTLKFTEFEDGVFAKVSAEPVQGNDMLVDLRVAWRFELELRRSECWQLRYIKSSMS